MTTDSGDSTHRDNSTLSRQRRLLLSVIPGLGHFLAGSRAAGAGFALVVACLVWLASTEPRFALFAIAIWLYQMYDGVAEPADPDRRASSTPSWLILGFGLLMLAESFSRGTLSRLSLVVPVLLVLFGVRLLLTYYREEDPS